jgi:SAM-dependent methyltransferase
MKMLKKIIFMKIASLRVSVKKLIFYFFKKIWLMEPIRNFVYAWAWSHIETYSKSSSILDIGTRNSQFAAFCAWQGFSVTAIDKDSRLPFWQNAIQHAWNIHYEIRVMDIVLMEPIKKYDCILAVYSLQHAGEADSAGYEQAARMLEDKGILLIVNEYDPGGTGFQYDRDDGVLRRYGPHDIESRIEGPLLSAGLTIMEKRFAYANYIKNGICWKSDHTLSNTCFIVARKNNRIN